MMAADIPHEQKCLEADAVKLTQFEFKCQTGKCKPADMCWECVCETGQRYNDFFGFGPYNKPDKWD
jgi:hypothetical protein